MNMIFIVCNPINILYACINLENYTIILVFISLKVFIVLNFIHIGPKMMMHTQIGMGQRINDKKFT